MFDFAGKVALISGAAGNLGQAVAEGFREAGASLVVADVAEDRLEELYGSDDDALIVPVDLTEEQSVQEMASRGLDRFGRIDVLANVAGGFRMGPPLHETLVETWDFMMDLNARSVFLASRAVLPHMIRQGYGRIVNVAARAAVQPKGRMAPYCASKAAVITLTESMAAEHRLDDINVNCILPGTIDTPQNRADMPDADVSTWVPPEDLAGVILFLASDVARAVKGAAVPVYGRS
jgi:NAD(P)-dependent dehydrogenase (short-subunit alcohol dehydrogenase family)